MVGLPDPAHGIPTYYYANYSNTLVSDATRAQYAAELASSTLVYSIRMLGDEEATDLPAYAFTPAFLTQHLTFNPGAIFVNQSCFGQSPLIASAAHATLRAAGVGRYLGWTKPVNGGDADQTDAFLLDRLLGEQSPSITKLDEFIDQRTPAQRPFPLDAVETAMQDEARDPDRKACGVADTFILSCSDDDDEMLTYPPVADGYKSYLIFTDMGGEGVQFPPIEYALPSINYMFASEDYKTPDVPANDLVTIYGTFPESQGTVEITNPAGTYEAPVVLWKPCRRNASCAAAGTVQIQARLTTSGLGSYGLVTVRSAAIPPFTEGIASNAVPLTEWNGSVKESDDETISDLDNQFGKGSGRATASFAFRLRADVQLAVQLIDTKPLPQNFTFDDIAAGSTGTLTGASGSFSTGNQKATFSLAKAVTITTGKQGLSLGTYSLSSVAWPESPASAPCGTTIAPGPSSVVATGTCARFDLSFINALACADNSAGFTCGSSTGSWEPPGYTFALVNPGKPPIVLTLNRTNYTIAARVIDPPAGQSTSRAFYIPDRLRNGDWGSGTSTETLSGLTFGAPLSPP
jgi:hypothetical protein